MRLQLRYLHQWESMSDRLQFQADLKEIHMCKNRSRKSFLLMIQQLKKLTENFEVDFGASGGAHIIVSSADVDARVMTRHILNDNRVAFFEFFTRRKEIILEQRQQQCILKQFF